MINWVRCQARKTRFTTIIIDKPDSGFRCIKPMKLKRKTQIQENADVHLGCVVILLHKTTEF